MHLTRLHLSGKLSFLVRSEHNDEQQLHYFEYIENNDNETASCSFRRIKFTPPFASYASYYKHIGSFNGLVCLYGGNFECCICNHVTGEYVMLPNSKRGHCSSGFGYLPSTNEYKVVDLYMVETEPDFIEVAVYTLGSGNGWRNVARLDDEICEYHGLGVFVNGALYWVDRREQGKVLVFDLAEEKFREPITPPPLSPSCSSYGHFLKELGGVLFFSQSLMDDYYDYWLLKDKDDDLDMKQHVEHEPLHWKSEFTLPDILPFAFTKTGGVLCLGVTGVVIYDSIASTSKELVVNSNFLQAFPHHITLVSLKELGEENIKTEASEVETESHDLPTFQLAR